MRRNFTGFALTLCVFAWSVTAFAHHGGTAYDRTKPLNLTAAITEFKWANPHVYVFFDAPDGKGNVDHWACESINPGMLSKQGWTRHTLNVGDKVTIVGYPSKTGSKVMLLDKVILANGKEMTSRLLD